MKKEWESVLIKNVGAAVYVPFGAGRSVHDDRPFHGFVFNEDGGDKDYIFSDGRVMHTESGCLFYLPKGSSYYVRATRGGGCYAINFEADISDKPFCIHIKDKESLQKSFKRAADRWKEQSPLWRAAAMGTIYEAIYRGRREGESQYISTDIASSIEAAVEKMERNFTDNLLTVSELSKQCGVSEVYFRKIFAARFGVSPKEYLVRKRIEYAKQLLSSGQFAVNEVALMCGYSEPCHFSREFSRRVGMPPSRYGENK